MFEAMDCCITLINENGGFNTVGWYKRGVISDKILIVARGDSLSSSNFNNNNNNNIDEDIHVDSGEISYHIVHLTPTNQDFLDNSTVLGSHLNTLKYVVLNIENPNNGL